MNRKSGIACAFVTSMLQPLHIYEILHDIRQPYFDFARLDRIDRHRFGAGANMEPARHQAIGKIRQSARIYLSSGDVPTNDFAVWRFHQLPGERRCEWE